DPSYGKDQIPPHRNLSVREFCELLNSSKLLRPDNYIHNHIHLLSTDGGINTQKASDAGTEANLDIQYTRGVGRQKSPLMFLFVGGDDFGTSLCWTPYFLDGVATPLTRS
ncbi:hypothetical protein BT96DRAFT_926333, partial [Gymnopus androsaceus JB14]